jgi:hypothetical protein
MSERNSLCRGRIPSAIAAILVLLGLGRPAGATVPSSLSWEEAQEQAARTGELILVEVGAKWCHACNVFATRTLADSSVRRELDEGWVFVSVDIDRRPDLHRLFHARGHEGLPSLHLLNPHGKEITRSGPLAAEELREMLAWARRRGEGSVDLFPAPVRRDAVATDEGPDSTATPELLFREARGRVLADADSMHGGFGTGEKYLLTPELDYLLSLASRGDGEARDVLRRFVTAVVTSPLHDIEEGGFHRYSVTREWSAPHYEKLLEVQAVMIEALAVDAATQAEALVQNREVLRRTLGFLDAHLLDPETGLYFASQNADVIDSSSGAILEEGKDYYARPALARVGGAGYVSSRESGRTRAPRRPGPAPPVDHTLLASANARLASALLVAGQSFGDAALGAAGRRLLEGVLATFRGGEGGFVRFRAEGESGPAGLEDLTELGRALLDAGGRNDVELARQLGARIVDEFTDPDGALRSPSSGSLAAGVGGEGARTIVFLARLAAVTNDEALLEAARRALLRLRFSVPEPEPAEIGLAAQALAVRPRGNRPLGGDDDPAPSTRRGRPGGEAATRDS